MSITFYSGENIPLEMHKVRIVQKLNLPPVEDRVAAIREAGFNTFLLKNEDVYMDMLTDSGVNAMSDRQQASMLEADDSYAGSATFTRLSNKLTELFGTKYFLPTHQGRACENIISQVLVKPGQTVPMNYHFTTSKAHITVNGGTVEEVFKDEALNLNSEDLFKGNMDIEKLTTLIEERGAENIAFVRVESGTNLIGGQPHSVENLKEVRAVCDKYNLKLVYDISLLADNLYFIKQREDAYKEKSIREITRELADQAHILYFSARKLGFARGGGIITNSEEDYLAMREFITLYEGFLTYGGMSVREMEAITVGLDETMDEQYISQGPEFIKFMSDELQKKGVPVVLPAGGLGCHIDASKFLEHVRQTDYPAGALAAAIYIASGARGMERGTMSEQRDENGVETLAHMELVRMAMPRRVFTLSQVKYAVDRIAWLYDNRELIGGMEFVEEPKVLRFFFGKLEAKTDWPEQLAAKFRADFGDSL
ncbi:tryptophanase [Caryophanon latum]|uniref:Tryptophanase n=1 Tax=Caryophanon latum TaxID=33977 RepID=A0A1C0YZ73_9BACL|nr:tryptophanase [Caryophanon latum]OCS92508.1 tryptophanase [Caryophanon latum]